MALPDIHGSVPDFTFLARIGELKLTTVLSDDYDFTRAEPYYPDTDFRADLEKGLA